MFDKFFKCEKQMKILRSLHSDAVIENNAAHKRLISSIEFFISRSKFPPLEDNKIVNPR